MAIQEVAGAGCGLLTANNRIKLFKNGGVNGGRDIGKSGVGSMGMKSTGIVGTAKGSGVYPRLVIECHNGKSIDMGDIDEDNKNQERVEKLQKVVEKNKGMRSYRIEDLSADSNFVRETFSKGVGGSVEQVKFIKRLTSLDFTAEDVQQNIEHVENILLAEYHSVERMVVPNKVGMMSKLMTHWMDAGANNSDPMRPSQGKISKAINNLFNLVENNLQNAERVEEPDFLPMFFEVCDKIIQKEIEAELLLDAEKHHGLEPGAGSNRLAEVSAALNQLIQSTSPTFFFVATPYLLNLAKGYLQNLFLVFFDLVELSTDHWMGRLSGIGYSILTIPENIDSLCRCPRVVLGMYEDNEYFKYFNRFYTCILSLIIKSETFSTTDLHIWKFILDLYSIHFIFMKSAYLNLFCRKSMESLRDVNPENILLRYIALIKIIPSAAMIDWSTVHPLHMGFIQLAKMYQNTSLYSLNRITHIHKAIIKQIFSLLFDFINKRYGNESEQRPVLLQITAWMKILSNYINYNRHYSPATSDQSSAVHLFKSDFQELLFRIKKRRTIASNEVWASECYRLILEACDGMK